MIDKEKYILKIDMSKKIKGGNSDNKLHTANIKELDIKSYQPVSSTGSFKNVLNNDNTSSFGLQQIGGTKFNKFVRENYKNFKKGGRSYHFNSFTSSADATTTDNLSYSDNNLMSNASTFPDLKFPKFVYGQDIASEQAMIF